MPLSREGRDFVVFFRAKSFTVSSLIFPPGFTGSQTLCRPFDGLEIRTKLGVVQTAWIRARISNLTRQRPVRGVPLGKMS